MINMTNINNINTEILSYDELDCVTGGSFKEVGGDSRFLNDLAGLCDRFGDITAFLSTADVAKETTAGWKKIGIDTKLDNLTRYTYYLDGKEITRQQAYDYACKKFGKQLQNMQGDYNY